MIYETIRTFYCIQDHIQWVMVYKTIHNENPPKPPNARWAMSHHPPIVRSTKICRHVSIRTNIRGSMGLVWQQSSRSYFFLKDKYFSNPRKLYTWYEVSVHTREPQDETMLLINYLIGIRIGISAPLADRPYFGFRSTSDKTAKRMPYGIRIRAVLIEWLLSKFPE